MSIHWFSGTARPKIAFLALAVTWMSRPALASDLLVATGPPSSVVQFAWPSPIDPQQIVWKGSGTIGHCGNVAVGPDGKLYLPSHNTNEIHRYFPNGGNDCWFQLPPTLVPSSTLVNPSAAEFNPVDGLLYVTLRTTRTIIKIDINKAQWWTVTNLLVLARC